LSGNGLAWNESNDQYEIKVSKAGTYTFNYEVENPVEGASLQLNGSQISDVNNLVENNDLPIFDHANKTVSVVLNGYPTGWNKSWAPSVSVYFSYTNAEKDNWGVQATIKFIFEEPQGPAMIEKIADLTAGEYYAGGYLTSYDYNGSILDWSANPYHLINGISTDLYTTPYAYTDGQLVKKEGEQYDAAIVTLEAVEGAANTYYVKVGEDYLTSTQAANRKLGKTSTPSAWVASDNAIGGISLKHVDTGVYLGTAGATSKLCRSYTSESTLRYGLVFFTVVE
jgi:hypothetical protein